jgi:hypothetical protein
LLLPAAACAIWQRWHWHFVRCILLLLLLLLLLQQQYR